MEGQREREKGIGWRGNHPTSSTPRVIEDFPELVTLSSISHICAQGWGTEKPIPNPASFLLKAKILPS